MVRLAVAFDAQRRISDPLFVLVLVLVFGFTLLFNSITYPGSHSHTMTKPYELYRAVSWSASPTLVGNLALIGIIIGVLVIGFGHVRPRDLGISWRNVAIGGAAFPLAWCAFAIAEGMMGFGGAHLAFNSAWNSGPGIDGILSDWVGQIFGNAPYEELLFRAFLIPQIYSRLPGGSVFIRIVAAVILSQVFFATCHIGTRVFKGHLEGVELFVSLLKVFASGLAFAWIYLRTLNPFVVSAFHALWNFPQPIYYPDRDLFPNETWLAYLLVAIFFGASFPRFQRYVQSAFENKTPT